MRIAELQPDHPSAIKARHDKWRRDLVAKLIGYAAERERGAARVTEAQPQTAEQQRLASMQANAKRANQTVKRERARQQQQKAQQTLQKISAASSASLGATLGAASKTEGQ